MQKISLILSLILFCSVITVYSQQTKSGTKSDTQKAIQERLNSYANAIVNNDYSTLDNFYTDDAISMPNYGKMLNGKNEIHRENMKMSKTGTKINSLELNVTKIINEKGDIVDAIGTYNISLTMAKNNQNSNQTGNFLSVLEKKGGDWKIKAEIWNSDKNPWQNKNHNMQMGSDSTGTDTTGFK